jgi:hypothetical protein
MRRPFVWQSRRAPIMLDADQQQPGDCVTAPAPLYIELRLRNPYIDLISV